MKRVSALLLVIMCSVPITDAGAISSGGLGAPLEKPRSPSAAIQQVSTLSASKTVTGFHDKLISVMKNADGLTVKDRYAALTPAVDSAFHLGLTAKQSAGRKPWKSSSETERNAMKAAFRHWTISTYAHQFDGYSGQSFKTVGEKPGPRDGMVLVETLFSVPNDTPVTFTYLMVKLDGRWGVYDVLVKRGSTAISQLAKHISEFRSIVRQGLPALTATLNSKARELLGE